MPTKEVASGTGGDEHVAAAETAPLRAWATLVTGEKYLPGVAIFAQSLLRGSAHHKRSRYPLVAMVTADVSAKAIESLVSLGCIVCPVKRLHPGHSRGDQRMAFAHFGDVWTKLRAFGLVEYERVIMVDSDMLVRHNIDNLMEMPLEEGHIMAGFACTCNPSKRPNYPDDWTPAGCAFTPQQHPHHTQHSLDIGLGSPRTHHLLNSGLVVLRPSLATVKDMELRIQTDAAIDTYCFPDQDFLADYFHGRFTPLPWVYNGLKTLRKSHPALWRDDEVKNVHYILAKPWNGQLAPDDADAVTHQWWWDVYRAHSWPAIIASHVNDA